MCLAHNNVTGLYPQRVTVVVQSKQVITSARRKVRHHALDVTGVLVRNASAESENHSTEFTEPLLANRSRVLEKNKATRVVDRNEQCASTGDEKEVDGYFDEFHGLLALYRETKDSRIQVYLYLSMLPL